jgi:D-alanyl-D-alanine carboxypeptidase
MSWLSRHGRDDGLCQSYANEAWHDELSVEPGAVCPSPRNSAVSA